MQHAVVVGMAVAAALAAAGEAKKPRKKPAPEAPAAPRAPVAPEEIRRALERGGAYLAGVVADDKQLPDFEYPLGARALYAAALVSAGKAPDDPLVVRLYRALETLPLTHVYSAALVAVALDVRFKETVRRLGPERAPKRLAGQDLALLTRVVTWIVGAQTGKGGGWSYERRPTGAEYDLSNTQFAVLALAIGQRYGLKVPAQTAERFAKACLALQVAEGGARETSVVYQVDLAAPEKSTPRRALAGAPAGWSYGPGSRGSYFAMTAATVGNLFVAKKLLRGPSAELDAAIDGGLLWLDAHWDTFAAQHERAWRSTIRNYYYTLWTLEKALDLGEIARLGERDWYQEEAAFLIDGQKADGSWGDEPLTPVATSFALLFLARATAATPLLASAPALFTGPGTAYEHDRVLVRKLGGYVSANAILASLAASQDARLVPLAREVLDNYAVQYKEVLVPPLAALLSSRQAAIARFAADALASLTGIASPDARKVEAWRASFDAIAAAEKGRDAAALRGLLGEELNAKLFEHLASAIERAKAGELAPDLVRALGAAPPERRERLHRVLCFLTGERMAYDAGGAQAAWERCLREKARAEGR
jgi:hypothetical protein